MDEKWKWLMDQFWTGKRWVALEIGPRGSSIYGCYSNYLDASDVCKRTDMPGKVIRIRVLGSLLKELNGIFRGRAAVEDLRHLSFAISKYPIRLFVPHANWEEDLLYGNYYPVLWLRWIQPLLAVRKYVVALDGERGLRSHRELYSTDEFPQAILALELFVRNWGDQNGTLLLIGQLSEQPFDCHQSESYDSDTTTVFYRTEWRDGQHIDIIQVHDPTLPIRQSIPMFARYFARRREIAFYDGKLKRIRPGDELDFIDLSVFDFRHKVI